MESNANRAKRLGAILKRYSEDPDRVRYIAKELNYCAEDLVKDMVSIDSYIYEQEWKIKEMCSK